MRSTLLGTALALVPSIASAGAPTEPLRASAEVEATGVDDIQGLEQRIGSALAGRLRRAEVLPRRSALDGVIYVEVGGIPDGGFRYDVHAEREGQTVRGTVTRLDCAECDEIALIEAVGRAVDKCIPPLSAFVDSPAPPPQPVVVEPSPSSPDDDRPALGTMGKTGVGLLVAGVTTAAVGTIFIVRGRAFSTRPGELEQEGVDFRPAGIMLAGLGGAALITGSILLGVDRRRRRRASIGWVPGGATVSLEGRF